VLLLPSWPQLSAAAGVIAEISINSGGQQKKKQAKDNFESPKKIKEIGGRKEKGSAL